MKMNEIFSRWYVAPKATTKGLKSHEANYSKSIDIHALPHIFASRGGKIDPHLTTMSGVSGEYKPDHSASEPDSRH